MEIEVFLEWTDCDHWRISQKLAAAAQLAHVYSTICPISTKQNVELTFKYPYPAHTFTDSFMMFCRPISTCWLLANVCGTSDQGLTGITDLLNSINWFFLKEKGILPHKYLRYPHKTITIVFTIFSAIKQAKPHLSSNIITKVSFFVYVIYSLTDAFCHHLVEDASAEE